MASNVYTKNEILQTLASKGYFIDAYTLNTFFAQWNVEAIFEDEQGSEFFDKNALDLVLNNLFNTKNMENTKEEIKEIVKQEIQQEIVQPIQQTNINQTQQVHNQNPAVDFSINDPETSSVLSNVSLSDGSPLINKIQNDLNIDLSADVNIMNEPQIDIDITPAEPTQKKKLGILEGAIQQTIDNAESKLGLRDENGKTIQDFQQQTEQIVPEETTIGIQPEVIPPMPEAPNQNESADFDDISLLSDSIEAQEKFRQYVATEFAKKETEAQAQTQQAQPSNEFKLDISERTISMIARTMAKKIAKHVSTICSADAKSAAELEEIKEVNKKLEERARVLENQNKKLKLLLAESNKNLNSYKPSIFGLYKKVPPQ